MTTHNPNGDSMETTARFDRLDTFIREGRVIRGSWGDGQERACLLLALAPEVGSAGNIAACPAHLIPQWLAELTPSIDDRVAEADWPEIVATYARVVRLGSERIDAAGWRRVLARFMVAILGDLPGEHPAKVAALWRRVLDGDEPTESEWQAAAAAAWAATARAARAARAAWAEARAAEAAAAEARAAAAAAVWSARAAAAEAEAAAAAAAAVWSARAAAAEAEAAAAAWTAEGAEAMLAAAASAWAAAEAAAEAEAAEAEAWSRIARNLFAAIEAEVAA